ncbi:sterigmatocystin 8-O-methyltransferase [Amylocarpus encephaloides]|uniref:Sterigmatocystin 8-O-methyltransferase n=1 Tax=Amylocarpus encephaloides TaxID=45428 RepID=A0A9P7YI38_9HELO|nr:sterigmatocystin 8-O-methyltransferase [Amylocarpus encephaloides]
MTDTQPTLNSLAAKISALSDTLTKYLSENNVPTPTFSADSPTSYENLSPEIFMTRQVLLDAVNDLWYLTQGPSESIFNYVHNCMPDAAAINILNFFDFWSAVPVKGSASYAEIAAHVSLPEDVVFRVLQHAITLRMFSETSSGVQHTSRSAALAQSAGLRALVSTILDDAGAPMMVMNHALQKYSQGKPDLTQDMGETSFALFHSGGAFGGHRTSWDLLENDGEGEKKGWRQRNFVTFMRYVKDIFHLEGVVLDAHDWKSAGKASVVDLGGSAGHDAVILANAFPNLTITVQDLPECKPVFEADLPAEMKSRVSFMEHSFFEPQPLQADIYILKMILHDWPDHDAVQILRALTPSLHAGARVILFEYVGGANRGGSDGPAMPRSLSQMGTSTDLRLMALFNGKERPVEAWRKIFHLADERFEVGEIKTNAQQNFFTVIEAAWRG